MRHFGEFARPGSAQLREFLQSTEADHVQP
jgi:hypothetical protein